MICRTGENKYKVRKSVTILFSVCTIKPRKQLNIYFIDVNRKANRTLYAIRLGQKNIVTIFFVKKQSTTKPVFSDP
jgi:hypothetical protein